MGILAIMTEYDFVDMKPELYCRIHLDLVIKKIRVIKTSLEIKLFIYKPISFILSDCNHN